jgi:hypothetical protein
MTVRPPADVEHDLAERARRAREMTAAVDHQGGPLYDVRTRGDEYRVDLAAGTCECPDYEHREVRCKHLRRVAIEVTAGEVPPPTAPRVTEHLEHPDQGGARYYRCECPVSAPANFCLCPDQGGARYYRCEGCGRESVYERLRRQGCRQCIESEADDATDASAGNGGTAGLAADGGVETTSHTEAK